MRCHRPRQEAWLTSYSWADISSQLLRYIADRTGIISFANIPLIWLFAGRNNIFLWATGWSFATFNLFHRHVAWIATIQAVVHTLLYLVIFIQSGCIYATSKVSVNILIVTFIPRWQYLEEATETIFALGNICKYLLATPHLNIH